MRDARINMIGEGANDVLRAFTALVGMRDVGLELEGVLRRHLPSARQPHPPRPLRRPQARLTPGLAAGAGPQPGTGTGRGRAGPAHRLARRQRRTAAGEVPAGDRRPAVPARPHRRRRDRALRQRLRPQPARPSASATATTTDRELAGHLETGRYYLLTARRRIKRSLADLVGQRRRAATTSLGRRMLKA